MIQNCFLNRGILQGFFRSLSGLMLAAVVASSALAADAGPHRVAIQIDQNDPAVMNLVLNNATNIMEYYQAKGEDVRIDLVAYGPGLHMLREDTSPVKDRIKQISQSSSSKIKFSACNNTKQNMEKQEGHTIGILPQASIVPSGAVHLMELQEQGWSYLKP
jgi:intracellular sulfur oxidation DsrE/DsrF family protein